MAPAYMNRDIPPLGRIIELVAEAVTLGFFVSGMVHAVPTATRLTTVLTISILCSIISGFTWAVLVRISRRLPILRVTVEYGGDTGGEPNGRESLIWAPITFGPVVFAASKMQPATPNVGWIQYMTLLIGFTVGACYFYGKEIRKRVLNKTKGYTAQEIKIGFIWVASLGIPSFFLFELSKHELSPKSLAYAALRSISFISIAWLPICIFVSLVNSKKYGFARGILAGLILEFATLTVTIANGERAKEWANQCLAAFGHR